MQKSSSFQPILREEWVWPTHAWIFHTHSIDDITVVDKHIHFSISSLNGMFFFQNSLLNSRPNVNTFEPLYPGIGEHCRSANLYFNILCESIIISSVLKNRSLTEPYTDIVTTLALLGLVGSEYNKTHTLFSSGVDLIHISGGELLPVGHYDTQLGSLTIINHSVLSNEIPPGVVYPSPSTLVLILFYAEIIVSFTLVTANLVLYLYYRKEPEVKATSYVITITVSCYLLMLYLVLLASSFINI